MGSKLSIRGLKCVVNFFFFFKCGWTLTILKDTEHHQNWQPRLIGTMYLWRHVTLLQSPFERCLFLFFNQMNVNLAMFYCVDCCTLLQQFRKEKWKLWFCENWFENCVQLTLNPTLKLTYSGNTNKREIKIHFLKQPCHFSMLFFFLSTFIVIRVGLDSFHHRVQCFSRWATEQAYVRKAIRGTSNVMSNFTMAKVFWGHNSVFKELYKKIVFIFRWSASEIMIFLKRNYIS